jgi:hypothetical protein
MPLHSSPQFTDECNSTTRALHVMVCRGHHQIKNPLVSQLCNILLLVNMLAALNSPPTCCSLDLAACGTAKALFQMIVKLLSDLT